MKLDRDRVLRARERLGYGIEKTAEEAGVSKNSVLRAEHGEDIRPVTARKIAAALGLRVADLIGESEALKAQPPLPDFYGERREELYRSWLDFVNRYVDRWEERINAGTFDLGSIHEFIATVEDLMPTLHELNADEQRGLPKQPHSFGAPAAKTGVAIHRLLDLIDPLYAAGVSKFKESDLEQLKHKRAEREDAWQDLTRRGA